MQSIVVEIFLNAIYAANTNIGDVYDQTETLLAEDTVLADYQLPLPKNQWMLELQHTLNIALATLQQTVINYARGPDSLAAQAFIVPPNSTEAKALCNMIRVKSHGGYRYASR